MRHFFCDSLKRFLMVFVATLAFVAPTFAANLPTGYTELEYIESTGTQWINTGINSTGSIGFETDLRVDKYGEQERGIFATTSGGTHYVLQIHNSSSAGGGMALYVDDGSKYLRFVEPSVTGFHKYTYNVSSDGKAYRDSTLLGTIANTSTAINYPFYLFARDVNGSLKANSGSSVTMKYFKIYRDGTLIADFVPAKRNSDNAVGMYDLADSNPATAFHTNAGTGTFVAGPVVCPSGSTLETRHESGLPVGYTKLDYIQSDGNSWIDTGIKGNMSYKYDIEFQQLDAGQYRNWGAFNQETYSGGSNMSLTWSYGFAVRWTVTGNNQQMLNELSSLDTNRHHLVIDNGYVTWDSVSKGRSTGHQDNYVLSYNLFLGTINPGGTTPTANAKSKYYSYKVWNTDGNLIQNFVPAKNSSNVIGMYDLVSGQFFTNAGTGTFTAGNTVSDPIVEQCVAGTGIKIATTKYTEDAFAGLMTTLSEAITKVTNIVDTTVQQATEIGNLATTKQDRPDTDCPAGRKCLLIMGADNKPHWYLIQE